MGSVIVYRMNDYDWVVSTWETKETNDFYNKEYGCNNDIKDVYELDLIRDGIWDEVDISEYNNEVINAYQGKPYFGALKFIGTSLCKYKRLSEVVAEYEYILEPYVIASTEW